MQAPILYQETRISPAPSSHSSTLFIPTPGTTAQHAPATSTLSNHAGRKRPFDEINAVDEESYARKHLATESSVYFRTKAASPRSFLWRVLNDRQILEVQCVDLTQEGDQRSESWLTFRIGFKDSIREGGIAFADAEDADALEIFVLSSKCELFTITLKRDLLLRRTVPTGFDPTTCVKVYASSPLTASCHAYRLFAMNSRELIVSLTDGSFMRLTRKANESGAQWLETIHDTRSWKSLRVFSKRHTVKYGALEVDISAIAATAKSPDGQVLWTVSLDHTLRAWSTENWKVLATMDLLNDRLEKEDALKRQPYATSPGQGTMMHIVVPPSGENSLARMDRDERYSLVIHSPKNHEFKMYEVFNTQDESEGPTIRLTDLRPTAQLVPPIEELMQTNIWQLEQFFVKAGSDWDQTQLWILARSGAMCKTFTITFNLLDDGVEDVWQNAWTTVDDGPLTMDRLRLGDAFPGDVEPKSDSAITPSERWLGFLTYPGRFSAAALETALHIYRRARTKSNTPSPRLTSIEDPFEERLSNAISSKVILGRLENDIPDYDKYRIDMQGQWQLYFSLLSHLHNRRHESISLAYDSANGLPWKLCADFIAPTRMLNDVEQRIMNTHLLRKDLAAAVDRDLVNAIYPIKEKGGMKPVLSRYLAIAKLYRCGLSGAVQETFRHNAAMEALHSSDEAQQSRVGSFFESSGLMSETTDQDLEDIAEWTKDVGGTRALDDDYFLGMLEWLDSEGGVRNTSDGRVLNRYGVKFTVATAQATLEHAHAILLDLLALLTLLGGDGTDEQVSLDLHEEKMFDAILLRLRHNQLLSWLAANSTQEVTGPGEHVTIDNRREPVSPLENIFIGDWRSWIHGKARLSLPELLTSWSNAWTYGTDLVSNWDGIVSHILAFLLQSHEYDLAADFQKFLSDTAWHRYLQARLHLTTGDHAIASACFQDAASELAKSPVLEIDTASLLTPKELEYFGAGQAKYFEHVAKLFGDLKIYTMSADFAELALEILASDAGTTDFGRSLADIDRKKSSDSPMIGRVNIAQEEVRVMKAKLHYGKLLHTRFKALVETGRFQDAYEALANGAYPPEQRHGAFQTFIEKCVKQDAIPTFLAMPFEGELAAETDKALAELARTALASGLTTAAPASYHQVLYAFRTQRGDFRGGAEILYEHLERLRHSNDRRVLDPEDEMLLHAYVLLINTMACCSEDDAWVLAEPITSVHGDGAKRKLVTLADVRREYNAEMDRRSNILAGRFPLIGGDDMDLL